MQPGGELRTKLNVINDCQARSQNFVFVDMTKTLKRVGFERSVPFPENSGFFSEKLLHFGEFSYSVEHSLDTGVNTD